MSAPRLGEAMQPQALHFPLIRSLIRAPIKVMCQKKVLRVLPHYPNQFYGAGRPRGARAVARNGERELCRSNARKLVATRIERPAYHGLLDELTSPPKERHAGLNE